MRQQRLVLQKWTTKMGQSMPIPWFEVQRPWNVSFLGDKTWVLCPIEVIEAPSPGRTRLDVDLSETPCRE